jgi:type I restriction enzyme S subunit
MNKIDELIIKLCPDGVPTFPLGEIGDTISGLRGKSKNDFNDGNAPFVSYVDISNNPALNFDVQRLVKVGKDENQNEKIALWRSGGGGKKAEVRE